MDRARKSCPLCRKVFARIGEHIKVSHHLYGEELFKLQDKEKERVIRLAQKAVYLSQLKREHNNYLQVALTLVNLGIPVVESIRENNKIVKHLTAEDIRHRMHLENRSATVPGKSPVQSTAGVPSVPVSPGTSGNWTVTVSPNRVRPSTSIRSPVVNVPAKPVSPMAIDEDTSSDYHVSHTANEEDPQEQVQAGTSVFTVADVHAPPPDMTSESESDSEGMSPPQSPESMCSPIRRSTRRQAPRKPLDTSGESEGISTPNKRRRISVVDSDSDTDTDVTHEEGLGPKQIFQRRYKRVGMYVEPYEQARILKNNYYINVLETSIRATKTTAEKLSRKDPVKNQLSIAMKIMKFCAPENKIDRFHWDHLSCQKLNLLAVAVTSSVQLKPYSIANFWKVCKLMCQEGKNDERADRKCKDILDKAIHTLGKLGKVNQKSVSQGASKKKSDEAYVRTEDLAAELNLLFQTFEKVKVHLAYLLNHAKKGNGLTPKELKYVNCVFILFNMLNCNRPVVFSNMELDRVTLAKGLHKVTPDGTPYHFLCTAKTASTHVAYIYLKQDMWQHLLDYVEYVRPKPATKDFKNVLFLNSEGKGIYNASNDLGTFFRQHEPKLAHVTSTRYHKVITTLGQRHLTKEQQGIVHAMLAYSAAQISMNIGS